MGGRCIYSASCTPARVQPKELLVSIPRRVLCPILETDVEEACPCTTCGGNTHRIRAGASAGDSGDPTQKGTRGEYLSCQKRRLGRGPRAKRRHNGNMAHDSIIFVTDQSGHHEGCSCRPALRANGYGVGQENMRVHGGGEGGPMGGLG